MVAGNPKAETISLMDMRAAMEAEMNTIIESLCGPGGALRQPCRLRGDDVSPQTPSPLPIEEDTNGIPFFFYLGFPRADIEFRLFDRNVIGSLCCEMITRESQKVASLVPKSSDMSVSLSENTSQDSSTIEEVVLSIPFSIIDEIADDSPAAEDGLLLIDEFVKFGNVENGDNLQSRLGNSQAGCIDEYNHGTSTMAWSWKFGMPFSDPVVVLF